MNNFDSDELLHLAIYYSEQGDLDKALRYAKSILDTDPDDARAEYFLGAIYAQLNMFDQAKDRIRSAIDKGVSNPAADFQLGLLYATSFQAEEAKKAWEPLQGLPETNPLFLFQRGLISLLDNRFQSCVDDLKEGIRCNSFNAQLNKDMEMVIESIQEKNVLSSRVGNSLQGEGQAEPGGEKILLSAYKRQKYDD